MTVPLRVLAVGQTPPPYGGQAMSIGSFIRGRYEQLEIFHVRMAFSAEMNEVGKVRLRKVAHLLGLIFRILTCRFRTGAKILYYPPAGPDLVPVLRDLVILLSTRWAFEATVFHFHAGGLSEIYPRLPRLLRPLYWRAYGRPELAIQPSQRNPPDGSFLQARRIALVPYGVPDAAGTAPAHIAGPVPVLLYVGVLRESKGLLVLIEACQYLKERGLAFQLQLMGHPESAGFDRRLRSAVANAGLAARTAFLGVRTGAEKERSFRNADIFCYPTYFESESFGLVLLEAMQFSLPVVTTRWRGIPDIVEDGKSGILIPTRDGHALATQLQVLLENPQLAATMGQRGRAVYLERYTEERFQDNMQDALGLLRHAGP